ncbi:hypothetical protein [Rhodococcus globerulus]|uniref:Uncharacterized protein n=1 Tax=Rhodococcus globerulus TaxID=33008 RepID=A0ABU4C5N2_RHOGO|nr:hypothetical protein [Rhodococcus globerulus]MDV6271820.1 hypothetical protein [Rhodococcus globerulus]
MNRTDDMIERLFYDPQAEVSQPENKSATSEPVSITVLSNPEGKTGEEIHRTLFSAQ